MSDFKSTSRAEGEVLHLAFEGTIDEDAQFPSVDVSKIKKVVIDLQAVKTINSVGIREWLDWIRPVAEKTEITLARCPKALVFQFNMVEGFLPQKAQVTSFQVPFYCEKCDREESVMFNVGKEVTVASGNLKLSYDIKSAVNCAENECGMEMDVTEGKYFQFLKRG